MTCFSPVSGYAAPGGGISFKPIGSWIDRPRVQVPCGQCIGCRMARSREWATRITHEASLYEHNSFVTLTYADEWLPDSYSVDVRVLQLFMKRLRKKFGSVRFFAVGEYGDKDLRPHYHLVLFGLQFPDLVPWRTSDTGYPVCRSPTLERLWPFGFSEIGTVTVHSAGYVARYCMKKVTGPRAEEHYYRINPVTGEHVHVVPEFITMSNRPGIGAQWFGEYERDCFPSDFLVVEGNKVPVPRYYKKLSSMTERQELVLVAKRKASARQHAADLTPDRLKVREEVQELRAKRLVRPLENDT